MKARWKSTPKPEKSYLNNDRDTAEIRERCLNLLARREHSRAELGHKLQAKGFAKHAVDAVIAVLAQEGWQSDTRFTEAFVRQRLRDGYGPLRIRQELLQRGIDAPDMDAAVAEFATGWEELLERLYRKKFPADKLLARNEWAKRVRFLQQRGFPYEHIRSLASRINIQLKDRE
ncbi:MAG: regulatory protein RecX [Gammaproteobacteria bacterium]